MPTYKTPDVYIEEISLFPPSVAEVATAIPVFIGYTEKGPALTSTRIDTLLDYENLFGGANPSAFSVTIADNPAKGLPLPTGDKVTLKSHNARIVRQVKRNKPI